MSFAEAGNSASAAIGDVTTPTPGTSAAALSAAAAASSVSQFYSGRSIFITGGTGFMGKVCAISVRFRCDIHGLLHRTQVLVEKLLRSCPGIRNIYLLIRPKRGQEVNARLTELINSPVSLDRSKTIPNKQQQTPFAEPLRISHGAVVRHDKEGQAVRAEQSHSDLRRHHIRGPGHIGKGPGNCVCLCDDTRTSLMTNTLQNTLCRSVSVVFHSAATVKFDEKLKLSVTINMLGTKRLVELCHRMQSLDVSRTFKKYSTFGDIFAFFRILFDFVKNAFPHLLE